MAFSRNVFPATLLVGILAGLAACGQTLQSTAPPPVEEQTTSEAPSSGPSAPADENKQSQPGDSPLKAQYFHVVNQALSAEKSGRLQRMPMKLEVTYSLDNYKLSMPADFVAGDAEETHSGSVSLWLPGDIDLEMAFNPGDVPADLSNKIKAELHVANLADDSFTCDSGSSYVTCQADHYAPYQTNITVRNRTALVEIQNQLGQQGPRQVLALGHKDLSRMIEDPVAQIPASVAPSRVSSAVAYMPLLGSQTTATAYLMYRLAPGPGEVEIRLSDDIGAGTSDVRCASSDPSIKCSGSSDLDRLHPKFTVVVHR